MLTGAGGSGISGVLQLCVVTWKKTTPQLSSEILPSAQLYSLCGFLLRIKSLQSLSEKSTQECRGRYGFAHQPVLRRTEMLFPWEWACAEVSRNAAGLSNLSSSPHMGYHPSPCHTPAVSSKCCLNLCFILLTASSKLKMQRTT